MADQGTAVDVDTHGQGMSIERPDPYAKDIEAGLAAHAAFRREHEALKRENDEQKIQIKELQLECATVHEREHGAAMTILAQDAGEKAALVARVDSLQRDVILASDEVQRIQTGAEDMARRVRAEAKRQVDEAQADLAAVVAENERLRAYVAMQSAAAQAILADPVIAMHAGHYTNGVRAAPRVDSQAIHDTMDVRRLS